MKSLLSRKLRLTLSALAVVLGVMFVAGSLVLSSTLNKSLDSLFANIYEATDVQASHKPNLQREDGAPGQADPIQASEVDKVKGLPGVKSATGVVYSDGARLIGKNGKVVPSQARVATNWVGEDEIVKLREGRGPEADDEIAINAALASSSRYKVGDTVGVLTLQTKKEFKIVGIVGYSGNRDSIGGEHTIAFTTPAAQQLLLDKPGFFTWIDVKAADGVSKAKLKADVQAALGDTYVVKTGEELGKDQAKALEPLMNIFRNVFLGFAGVSLFVSIFLIINTFSIIVAQRTRELALMRALGAGGGQVIGSVLLEALVIGLISSVLGLVLGIGVGWLLTKLAGGDLPSAGLVVPPSAIIASFVIGVGITAVAALAPALRASRIPPIAAMRDAANTVKPLTKVTISGLVVTALGVAGLWVALAGDAGDSFWLLLGGGLLLSFIGVALLTPIISKPVVSVLGALFSWSMPGKLGRGNSARNPRRTAITAAALMIGIALVTGVSVIISSFKASISDMYNTGLNAELIIAGEQTGPVPPTFAGSVIDQAKSTPGVSSVSALYFDGAKINGENGFVYAVNDLPATAQMFNLKVSGGSLGQLQAGQLVVDEDTAKDKKLSAGGTVQIQTSRGEPVTYTVAGVFKKSTLLNGFVLPQEATKNFQATNPAIAYIKLASGAKVSEVQASIDKILADSPDVSAADVSSYVEQQTKGLDGLLTMVQILLGLAMIIAVLGVINTLALSMIERTRELGMLRAVGMSRGQMMGMVTVESVVISVFGAILGIAVGIGLGWAVIRALHDIGIKVFALPWGTVIAYLIVAAVVGVIAAFIPAIRAARTDVLRAISYE